ncbi:MAG TPA: hypothetical protein VKA32_04725, partial [Gammaproteobacteria bacterium]|nr:hypothetical protein [Gammaproteobacteria bacterium]
MAYNAPEAGAVDFSLASGYAAPAAEAIDFSHGEQGPSLGLQSGVDARVGMAFAETAGRQVQTALPYGRYRTLGARSRLPMRPLPAQATRATLPWGEFP